MGACGNAVTATDAGQSGVTVDGAGAPVIVVTTCEKATPAVELYEGRSPDDPEDQPNTERGGWTARGASEGVVRLVLASPGAGWRVDRAPGSLERGLLFVVNAATKEDADASLGGVSFRVGDLEDLSSDQVMIEGSVVSSAEFAAYECG